MIKAGDVIKHSAFMDVAIQIITSSINPHNGDIYINGIWLNQGQQASFIIKTRKYPVGVPIEMIIKKDQVQNWTKCLKPNSDFIRQEEWKVLE